MVEIAEIAELVAVQSQGVETDERRHTRRHTLDHVATQVEPLQPREVKDPLNARDAVLRQVQLAQLLERLQSLQLVQRIVAQVQLLQRHQASQALHATDLALAPVPQVQVE